MIRSTTIALAFVISPAIAHECELPPAQYDHDPSPLPVIERVRWDHIATSCGWNASMDSAPQVPQIYANGGAELFNLNRPNACRYKDLQGVWHVKLAYGGGWRDSEIDRCKRFEFGSINGWRHRDPMD